RRSPHRTIGHRLESTRWGRCTCTVRRRSRGGPCPLESRRALPAIWPISCWDRLRRRGRSPRRFPSRRRRFFPWLAPESRDLDAEEDRHGHLPDLILHLLDLVDMRVFVVENSLERFPGSEIAHVSRELDRFVVGLDGVDFRAVVVVELQRHVLADMHRPEIRYDRDTLQEQDPAYESLGVLHLVYGAFLEMVVKLAVAPVAAHLGMDDVLADGGELVR